MLIVCHELIWKLIGFYKCCFSYHYDYNCRDICHYHGMYWYLEILIGLGNISLEDTWCLEFGTWTRWPMGDHKTLNTYAESTYECNSFLSELGTMSLLLYWFLDWIDLKFWLTILVSWVNWVHVQRWFLYVNQIAW